MPDAILIGDDSLTIACGRALLSRGWGLSCVVTDAPRVTDWVREQGLPLLAPDLLPPEADWLFNVAGLRVLGPDVLARARRGAVNFHDGPLPRYAGLNAPVWALIAGEARHGITWHQMTGQVDGGDILAQAAFDIAPDDTAFTLNAKCFEAGLQSFSSLLDAIDGGTLSPRSQDEPLQVFARDARPPFAGVLDMSQGPEAVARLVRALDHGPYANPLTLPKLVLAGQVLTVSAAQVVPETGACGQVLAVAPDSITLGCGTGAVRLSGLTCLLGLPVDLSSLAPVGTVLPAPDPEWTDALASVAKGEPGWRAVLRGFVPVRLAKGGARDTHPLPDAPDADLIAAFAVALMRHMGLGRVGLGLSVPAVQPMLSDWVPLMLDPAQDMAAQLQAHTARMSRAPTFPRDLMLRDPTITPSARPDVMIGASDAPIALDLKARKLAHDEAALLPDDAARLMNDMTMLLRGEALHDDLNDTARPYPRACLHKLIQAQVALTPDAPALVYRAHTLTYADLNARANRLAHLLIAEGVGPDMPVGLCAARGPDLLVGALAILKAGGAYLPLDPDYPAERLAHYLRDSGAPLVVCTHALATRVPAARQVHIDTDTRIANQPATDPETAVTPDHLAYLIYTSGSTGTPKGVMVEHGNVANFFAGMDDHIRHDPPGVWLAVTSLSFDISVLELFWTLARGFKVVLVGDQDRLASAKAPLPKSDKGMQFSLMYWGNDDGPGAAKYRLLLEGARFADTHGFCAIWTPERHFHAFGGPFPNPSVTGAAVAAVTKNLAVRAGSIVVPLHHPIRIAEDWAVIDNLTGGRTGLGIASGWHPVDFVIRPENRPPNNRAAMLDMIDTLRRLWRGEEVAFDKGDGQMMPVQTLPRPVSQELNIWLTTAGNPDTWAEAGRLGAHVLTHLLGQSVAEVGEKIQIYHAALRDAGHDPANFTVTLMLHTFVARDRAHARAVAEGPMKAYLHAAAGLVKQYAWAFPAFKRPAGASNPMQIDLSTLSQDEVDGILDFAFNRYFDDSGLFGTVEDCLARVDQLKAIGVTEVACLIDYGIHAEQVLEALYPLAEVVRRANDGAGVAEDDFSIPAQIVRHGVTHLQCTPSMAQMLMGDADTRVALARVPNILLGGEALPAPLAAQLADLTGQPVRNLYGPTETTIWSSTTLAHVRSGVVGIGRPIANTTLHVLDDALRDVPEGELFIGGDGVARGYWNRPELTAERFISNPFGPGMLYRTGDLVRRRGSGLDFLGRIDGQVKLRGHRIELGEVEAALTALPGIRQAAAIVREDVPGDPRLVAYYTGQPQGDLRASLAQALPPQMVPAHFVPLPEMPLTPNRKIDRNALPAPRIAAATAVPVPQPAGDLAPRIAAIWAQVLGVPQVMPYDNFFSLGGHSLLAVQAHRQMRDALGLPGLSITDLFRFPVLADLARHLQGAAAPAPIPAQPVPPPTIDRNDAMARRRAMRAQRSIDA